MLAGYPASLCLCFGSLPPSLLPSLPTSRTAPSLLLPGFTRDQSAYACQLWLQSDGRVEKGWGGGPNRHTLRLSFVYFMIFSCLLTSLSNHFLDKIISRTIRYKVLTPDIQSVRFGAGAFGLPFPNSRFILA